MSGCDFLVDVVLLVDVVAVEFAVARQGGGGTIDPVEQGTNLRSITDVVIRQLRHDDAAGVDVSGELELAPGTAPLGPVLLPS
jgi:hypothetical protein